MNSSSPAQPLTAPLLRSLSGLRNDTPPIWLMRQAGRYLPEYRKLRETAGSFLDLCYTPELAAEVTLQPVRRFGLDAAILFSDILVIPDALGQPVEFVQNEGPKLQPVTTADSVKRLNRGGLLDRLAPVLETVERVRAKLSPEVVLIGFCGAPWTVATYMVQGGGSPDQAAARMWAYRDPNGFGVLIDLLVEASIEYLCAQVRAGAQVLQIFDTWAGNLPEEQFRQWSLAPARRIVKGVKQRAGDIPIIGFPRGAGPLYRVYAEETGIDAVSCDAALPLAYIRKELQPHTAVQGNLDPLLLAENGPAMEARVRKIIGALGQGPFIFNLGHGVVPDTPPENVARLVELVRESGQG